MKKAPGSQSSQKRVIDMTPEVISTHGRKGGEAALLQWSGDCSFSNHNCMTV